MTTPPPARAAGFALIAASLLAVSFMALHPRVHSHGEGGLVQAFADVAFVNAVVHGSLVGLFVVLLFGNAAVAERIGGDHPAARLGLICYAFGTMPIAAAALTSGFIVPEFVSRYGGRPAEELATVEHILRFAFVAVKVASKVGVVSLSLSLLCWGITLIRRRPVPGVVGLLAGGVPLVLLAAGHLRMDIHGMLVFTLAQAAWGLAVGVPLARGRL